MKNQHIWKPYMRKQPLELPHSCPKQPSVSIIVPTFQHEDYINECIDGILAQEECDYEVVIIEDESSDRTRELCIARQRARPDRIRLILNHRENNIYVHGRPTGIFSILYATDACQGSYIAFCEGDDCWIDSHKIHDQVETIKNMGADACFSFWRQGTGREGALRSPTCPDILNPKRPTTYFHLSTHLMTRAVWLRHFDELPLDLMFDTPMMYRLQARHKCAVLRRPTSFYRLTGKGIWTGMARKKQRSAHWRMWRQLADIIPEKSIEFRRARLRALISHPRAQSRRSLKFIIKLNKIINKISSFKASFYFIIKKAIARPCF